MLAIEEEICQMDITSRASCKRNPKMFNKKIRINSTVFHSCLQLLTVFAFAVGAASAAGAAEWRIEPLFKAGGETDDNAVLDFRTDEEEDISGLIAEGLANFEYSSPLSSFRATPLVRYRDYGDPDFDSTDSFFTAEYNRDFRSTSFSLAGSYSNELVRTAERADADLEVDDPSQIPDNDSGRVFLRDRRVSIEVDPRLTYRLSNVSTLDFNVIYQDVQYDEKLLGLLNDYTNIRADLSYSRAWSRRNTGIFSATYRQYEAEDSPAIDGYGIGAGFETRLSETTVIRAIVGMENTELDTGENDVNPVANIYVRRRLETIIMLAQYRRVISGGGGGSLTARDMLNLNFTRRLNDRVSAGIGVRAYSTSALEEGTITIDERDYLQLRGQFIWNLSRNFSIEANYRYTILNRQIVGEAANSNNITIFLNWRPTPFVRSM